MRGNLTSFRWADSSRAPDPLPTPLSLGRSSCKAASGAEQTMKHACTAHLNSTPWKKTARHETRKGRAPTPAWNPSQTSQCAQAGCHAMTIHGNFKSTATKGQQDGAPAPPSALAYAHMRKCLQRAHQLQPPTICVTGNTTRAWPMNVYTLQKCLCLASAVAASRVTTQAQPCHPVAQAPLSPW